VAKRKVEAKSLAEYLSGDGGICPIPNTHDRLFELHYWWHEMARTYHEPNPFRYSVGAFVQAARNVTFVLQKEKTAFKDFTWYNWYKKWVAWAKNDSLLSWLNEQRTALVHKQALETNSWLEMACVGNPRNSHGHEDEGEDPFRIRVSPFQCTHYYMSLAPPEDHGHEFIRFWGINDLKERELLEACAEIYDRLDELVSEAHRHAGAEIQRQRRKKSAHALPCMDNALQHRVARTEVRDGREVWQGEPPGLHRH
jgi:hypothetical protein